MDGEREHVTDMPTSRATGSGWDQAQGTHDLADDGEIVLAVHEDGADDGFDGIGHGACGDGAELSRVCIDEGLDAVETANRGEIGVATDSGDDGVAPCC